MTKNDRKNVVRQRCPKALQWFQSLFYSVLFRPSIACRAEKSLNFQTCYLKFQEKFEFSNLFLEISKKVWILKLFGKFEISKNVLCSFSECILYSFQTHILKMHLTVIGRLHNNSGIRCPPEGMTKIYLQTNVT